MKHFHAIRLVAMLVAFWPFGGVHALTIYRVGGADLPPPELDAPYEFVQLAWADVVEDQHGSVEQLDLGVDHITPQRLDSDVNLTPLIEERGGRIMILDWQAGWTSREPEDGLIFDGDPNTAYLGDGHYTRAPGYGPPNKLWIFDFGGRFLIERIRIYPRQIFLNDRFIERFLIGINDGDPLKDGTRDYPVIWYWQFASLRNTGVDFDIVHDISENTQSLIELQIPPTPIQSLYFEAPENTRGIWEIAEFEIYGGGHAPFASYVSNVIDLGRPASLGDLVWSGNVEEGARIELSTHSGDDLDPNTYRRYTFRGDEKSRFDREGRLLDLQSYAKLERGEKAGITHDTENWSPWGAPLDFAAGAVDLGGGKPRSSVQFRADFESTPDWTGRLDYVQFAVSAPPVVSVVLAEIEPVEVRAGEATLFTYKVRPHFAVDDLGFDSIAIDTPERPLGVEAVRVDGEEVAYEVVRLDERGLAVRMAPVGLERTGDLIEIDFRAAVFRFGTVFSGRVFDSAKPNEVPQKVQGGDADPLVDGAGLSVVLRDVSRETVRAIRLQSPIFTPNGDGVNDAVQIQYELFNVDLVPVVVEVYDLAGRKVAEVIDGKRASGRFRATWDGRGADGELMPPGTYLLHLVVETDGGRETARRVVGLAY